MEHTIESLAEEQHVGGGVKEIWRVTIILSVLTIVELGLGFWMTTMPFEGLERHFVKGVIVVLMLAKAFYIVAYFMHLKFEKKALVYTIIVPVIFIIGLILVLTNESHHWISLRNVLGN